MRRFPEILTIALCLILFAVLTACGPKGAPLTAEELLELLSHDGRAGVGRVLGTTES